MDIIKTRDGAKLTVALVGRLDAVTALQLDKELRTELDGVTDLTIDLAKLDYIASAGLRILLKTQNRMNQQGTMVIKKANREVLEVLEMTGFSRLLTLEDSKPEKKLQFEF